MRVSMHVTSYWVYTTVYLWVYWLVCDAGGAPVYLCMSLTYGHCMAGYAWCLPVYLGH